MSMAHDSTEFTEYISLIVNDGGPESYAKVASNYELFQKSVNWPSMGPRNVCEKWQAFHADVVKSKNTTSAEKHRIFDAGCGTGFVAEVFRDLKLPTNLVEIFGGDFSPDMLSKARAKNIYTNLQVVNLKESLPYEPGFFNSIVSAGVFTPGHCGPECLPNLTQILKNGGYLILTCIGYSDKECYDEDVAVQWKRQIRECNCELIEDNPMPYRDGLEKGAVLVIHKTC